MGKSVTKAVANVNDEIAPALLVSLLLVMREQPGPGVADGFQGEANSWTAIPLTDLAQRLVMYRWFCTDGGNGWARTKAPGSSGVAQKTVH